MTDSSDTGRTDDAVARFVERFGLLLADAGMARMPSRVFARLLATDSGRLTATELAESLQVSPAAISGAVRYLDHVRLVGKGREPGERRDHYAVTDGLWFEVYANRDEMFAAWGVALGEGIDAVGLDSPAGRRLDQTRRFFEFLQKEMGLVMEKWREQEAAR